MRVHHDKSLVPALNLIKIFKVVSKAPFAEGLLLTVLLWVFLIGEREPIIEDDDGSWPENACKPTQDRNGRGVQVAVDMNDVGRRGEAMIIL